MLEPLAWVLPLTWEGAKRHLPGKQWGRTWPRGLGWSCWDWCRKGINWVLQYPVLPRDKVELWITKIKDTHRYHCTHFVWQFLSLERQKQVCAFHPFLITFKVCLNWDATQFRQRSAYHVPLGKVPPLFAPFPHGLFAVSLCRLLISYLSCTWDSWLFPYNPIVMS